MTQYSGFGVTSGPTTGPPNIQPSFGSLNRPSLSPPAGRPNIQPPFASFNRPSLSPPAGRPNIQPPFATFNRPSLSPPVGRPNIEPPFGSFNRPSVSPPPQSQSLHSSPYVPPRRSPPRRTDIPDRMPSPSAAIDNSRSFVSVPPSSAGFYRTSDPRRENGQKSVFIYNNGETLQRPSSFRPNTQFSTSGSLRPSVPSNIHQVQDVNGSPLNSVNERSKLVVHRTRSPPFGNIQNVEARHSSFGSNQGTTLSPPPALDSRARSPCDYSDLLTSDDLPSASPFGYSYTPSQRNPIGRADVQLLKRTRSPPSPFANEDPHFARIAVKRPSISPVTPSNRSNVSIHTSGSELHQRLPSSMLNGHPEAAADSRPTSFQVPKRTRSPPVPSSDQVIQGSPNSTQDETEREMQAKAKRLARFRVELSHPEPSNDVIVTPKFSTGERHKPAAEHSMDISDDSALPEYGGLESSSVIIGLCPDMCPGKEREERERKGDLDQYERFDGERNQSSNTLAVKKYNRTAEREAALIRPMPILQMTINYLLTLLKQPYDEKFLGLYNFLWDRMRAIRMDLRMQHIFDMGAIAMLEQMIRLHIIAMHELCEYTKGEGFSEGFDAHLNIEQMNKTSVELFQMYDDHRKKGINVPTEKEFRGYYALLKLDKHPGYKVEPAELSLDLAKMTPQIRHTSEVLFARDVARACRTGNYIAFFRLARKASYLQACLMHAHFAKLRTQALASLHSGLQNNQGIPVSTVSKWLGMEEEDIESLAEYHGFVLKDFEEPYMVKEGQFLNSEKDYPTNCSKLVHFKRSRRISEDVSSSSSPQLSPLPVVKEKKPQLVKAFKHDLPVAPIVPTADTTHVSDEDMAVDPFVISSPKHDKHALPMFAPSIFDKQSGVNLPKNSFGIPSWNFSPVRVTPQLQPSKVVGVEKPNLDFLSDKKVNLEKKAVSLPESPGRILQEFSPASKIDFSMENSITQNVIVKDLERTEPVNIQQETEHENSVECYHEKEAAEAKLKLILRIWRRRASKLKEVRMQRLLAANAALNSLSLGPPIRQKRHEPNTFGEFNIDRVMMKRYEKHERSWSRLNVSDVVADQLSKRNPVTKCLCFKVIVSSQVNHADKGNFPFSSEASSWLLSKLMPNTKDEANLVKSVPGLSIWKKWLPGKSSPDPSCCLSIIKDVNFDDQNEMVLGTSAVIFLLSETISWDLQKTRLQNVLKKLPFNSRVPFLILHESSNDSTPSASVIDRLGLSESDKSKLGEILVLQIGCLDGFFSDDQLKEGLEWLASESPLQPVLNLVKTRDLVMTHLNFSLEMVDKASTYEISPNHCISAFNEALDRSILEISEAASSNPSNWPCLEINMLDKSTPEFRASKLYLPSIGWSLASKVESIVRALRELKLPDFSYDISWLGRGCNAGLHIENQRLQLENCLAKYLTESSKMMGLVLAMNEARVLLQKNARLELHNSSFFIVPQWVLIFRRIFNWRLMNLSTGDFSSAYVLDWENFIPSSSKGPDNFNRESSISSTYNLMHPSLDEMVQAGFSPGSITESEICELSSNPASNFDEMLMDANTGEITVTEDDLYSGSGLNDNSELTVGFTVNKEGDKLRKLLESCNIMQNMIEKKLSVYF